MTIDELAGRLVNAAGEVEGILVELEREQPARVDGPPPSVEVFERIRQAWLVQRDLAAHAVELIQRLAGDVAQAAENYRAADRMERGPSRGD